jgi:penicillin-binding protein 2
VDRQRQQQQRQRPDEAKISQAPGSPWWDRAWEAVVDAVTASPEPEEVSPLLIAEQEAFHPLIDDVSRAVMAEVESNANQYPGVQVIMQSRRVYPEGFLASHALGYMGRVSPDEEGSAPGGDAAADDPYKADDLVGRMGVEAEYESLLRGQRGRREEFVDRRDEVVSLHTEIDSRPGRDIQLTFDLELQRETERLLKEAVDKIASEAAAQSQSPARAKWPHGAAAVVLDVQTGAVLAAASVPNFDPNALSQADAAAWRQMNQDIARPLFNRTIAAGLPPGSVFKVVSAIAAIESHVVDPHETFYCQGYLERPDELRCLVFQKYGTGHGPVQLVDAIKRSCNVYFFNAAKRMGPKRLCAWATALGFGHETGIDLPGESAGILPTPANIKQLQGHPWWPGDTPRLAIGQASLTVTPLQIARLMATVANGGKLVTPHVMSGFGPGFVSDDETDADLLERIGESRKVPGLSASTLALVRAGLRGVVEEGGTAHSTVWMESVSVAGKTGTADPGGGKPAHAWFAGYAPADSKPRIAFAVVLEHGGHGGTAAGPVARGLVEKMVELGGYFSAGREQARR